MAKRAFIIHGWDGYPEEGWFPWLRNELVNRGFTVEVPAMPHADRPTIQEWVQKLSEMTGDADTNTFFIGHSMGCQTILRYLASLKNKKIGGIVLVAGFLELRPLEDEEEKRILEPWIRTPIDFTRVRQATSNITAIFSDDDEWVPLERNIQLFKKNLGNEIQVITEHNKQHFSGSSGITSLPSALDALLKYSTKD